MTEKALRNQIGIALVIANLIVVLSTIVLYLFGGFLYDEMTTTVALIVPMFSVYTTAVIKAIVGSRTSLMDESPVVSPQYVFISWLFPAAFSGYLIALVLLKAFNIGFSNFEEFKGLLVASEVIFGAYVGLILASMFDIEKKPVK
jgi:hypothetical protein